MNETEMLPSHLFFTGVPGSHWSAIAQDLEEIPGFNTSDHKITRDYSPGHYTGHRGAYFGEGMEFTADIEDFPDPIIIQHINSPWHTFAGTKIVKSHEWAFKFPLLKRLFPESWIMLVYRPDMASYAWWHEAGGFNIKYPSYAAYKDSSTMLSHIIKQNQAILQYAYENNAIWNHYSAQWVANNFDYLGAEVRQSWNNVLVALIK
jgi:hypothetical protein